MKIFPVRFLVAPINNSGTLVLPEYQLELYYSKRRRIILTGSIPECCTIDYTLTYTNLINSVVCFILWIKPGMEPEV